MMLEEFCVNGWIWPANKYSTSRKQVCSNCAMPTKLPIDCWSILNKHKKRGNSRWLLLDFWVWSSARLSLRGYHSIATSPKVYGGRFVVKKYDRVISSSMTGISTKTWHLLSRINAVPISVSIFHTWCPQTQKNKP